MVENTDNLILTPLPDGRRWRVRRMFAYWVTPPGAHTTSFRISVFNGFLTDFASIPRAFWRIFPPWGKYGVAAIIHDYIYAYHDEPGSTCFGFDREYADNIFLWVMSDCGVGRVTRNVLYAAVRLFGARAWRKSLQRYKRSPQW